MTPGNLAFLGRLKVSSLVTKFLTFYGTRKKYLNKCKRYAKIYPELTKKIYEGAFSYYFKYSATISLSYLFQKGLFSVC